MRQIEQQQRQTTTIASLDGETESGAVVSIIDLNPTNMKIDILRSTNPALSLSSQIEDQFDLHPFYGVAVPLELLSLNHPHVTNLEEHDEKALRSKSAPPVSEGDSHSNSGSSSGPLHPHRLSSSYEDAVVGTTAPWSGYPLPTSDSSGTAYGWYPHNRCRDDGSSSPSTDEENPEIVSRDSNWNRLFPEPAVARVLPPVSNVAAARRSLEEADENSSRTSSTATTTTTANHSTARHSKEQIGIHHSNESQQQQQASPREYPVSAFHSPNPSSKKASPSVSACSSTSFSQQYHSGGVPVLRPFPVKTVPPIVSAGGGLVTPTPRLASTSFVPQSPLQQHPTEKKEDKEPTAELVRSVPTKVVLPASTAHIANSSTQKSATIGQTNKKEPWCQQASEKALQEAKEKDRLAELRRREEIQCNFPNSYSNMPPLPPSSGRASVDPDHGDDLRNPTEPHRSSQPYGGAGRVSSVRSSSSSIPPPLRTTATTERRMLNDDDGGGPRSIQSTPVFERLVTDEVREIQVYTRMVESQSVELEKLRKYQKDLEKRLQQEARHHEQLEATLEMRERDWVARFETLETEIQRLSGVVKAEENKNKLLLDQIRKKDQDIQGMLKKKVCLESHAHTTILVLCSLNMLHCCFVCVHPFVV